MVLEMSYLSISNADVKFIKSGIFTQKSYNIVEALLITNRIELIDKKIFAKAILDENTETFIVHVVALDVPIAMHIYLLRISWV